MKKEIIVNIPRDELVLREDDTERAVPLHGFDLKDFTDSEIEQIVKNKLRGSPLILAGTESCHFTIIRD